MFTNEDKKNAHGVNYAGIILFVCDCVNLVKLILASLIVFATGLEMPMCDNSSQDPIAFDSGLCLWYLIIIYYY